MYTLHSWVINVWMKSLLHRIGIRIFRKGTDFHLKFTLLLKSLRKERRSFQSSFCIAYWFRSFSNPTLSFCSWLFASFQSSCSINAAIKANANLRSDWLNFEMNKRLIMRLVTELLSEKYYALWKGEITDITGLIRRKKQGKNNAIFFSEFDSVMRK